MNTLEKEKEKRKELKIKIDEVMGKIEDMNVLNELQPIAMALQSMGGLPKGRAYELATRWAYEQIDRVSLGIPPEGEEEE